MIKKRIYSEELLERPLARNHSCVHTKGANCYESLCNILLNFQKNSTAFHESFGFNLRNSFWSLSRPSSLDADDGAAKDPVRQVGLARADGLHHLQQAGPDQEDQAAGGTGRAGGTVRHRQVPVHAVPVRRREVEDVVRGVGGFYVVAARREEGGLVGSKDNQLVSPEFT